MSTVEPSGAERATRSFAIVLPPPTTFSMMTERPSARDICSPMRRATVSVPPPAAYGTTSVTGLDAGSAPACNVNAASHRQLTSAALRSITANLLPVFLLEAMLPPITEQRVDLLAPRRTEKRHSPQNSQIASP